MFVELRRVNILQTIPVIFDGNGKFFATKIGLLGGAVPHLRSDPGIPRSEQKSSLYACVCQIGRTSEPPCVLLLALSFNRTTEGLLMLWFTGAQ
jgi:hypothetical protein